MGMQTVSISEFKATCLALVDRVRRTGQPILITKRGVPVAQVVPPPPPENKGNWLGKFRDTGKIVGDIVSPVIDADEWENMGS